MLGRNKLFLVCTGLGIVNRGFENYISSLANNLIKEELSFEIALFSGGPYKSQYIKSKRVFQINRGNPLTVSLFGVNRAALLELYSFFIGFLPHVLWSRPKAIYLGEYALYCLLFKVRAFLGLNFKLVLYTGGQVIPGLFDQSKDYIHNVTDAYKKELEARNIPLNRQFLLPHFVENDFVAIEESVKQIKAQARGKKIVLSVGYIDRRIKRMDQFVQLLAPHAAEVFPIILGHFSAEAQTIENELAINFGRGGYIMGTVSHNELGTFYSAADVFMLCSRKESFGLAYLEALSFGLPVLCHDFSEARYVLKDEAIFIDMNNEIEAPRQLGLVLKFPSTQDSARRTRFVLNNYSWSVLKDRYIEMFNVILYGP